MLLVPQAFKVRRAAHGVELPAQVYHPWKHEGLAAAWAAAKAVARFERE